MGGSQDGGEGEGKEAAAVSRGFHRRALVQVNVTARWSLRASLSSGTQSRPQEPSPKCQQHPHQLLEAPFPSPPGSG